MLGARSSLVFLWTLFSGKRTGVAGSGARSRHFGVSYPATVRRKSTLPVVLVISMMRRNF